MTTITKDKTADAPKRFVRADGPDKVTGSGRYTADLSLTGTLVAKFRYAQVSHARITKLDVTAARAMPGVFAVITDADVPDVRFGPMVQDRRLFARDVVRFEGEIVAAVAAIDAETAQRAVDAIVVEYSPLPVVNDVEAALSPDSPLVHEEFGTNIALRASLSSCPPRLPVNVSSALPSAGTQSFSHTA